MPHSSSSLHELQSLLYLSSSPYSEHITLPIEETNFSIDKVGLATDRFSYTWFRLQTLSVNFVKHLYKNNIKITTKLLSLHFCDFKSLLIFIAPSYWTDVLTEMETLVLCDRRKVITVILRLSALYGSPLRS